MLIATVGGLVTGVLLIGAVQKVDTPQAAALSLETVAINQLDDAVLSLDAKAAGTAAEEARQCKTPLAFITVVAEPGSTPGSIRIRSGGYLSPSVRVTDSPRRIAIPFPAPYPTGKGVLSVEGTGRGLTVWLSPGRHLAALDGAAPINVVWTPKNPC